LRAPFQILVFPFIRKENNIKYAIFKRTESDYWQGIAGGGEDAESFLDAARRECFEEAGISEDEKYIKLDSVSSIPVENIMSVSIWDKNIYVICEHSFGVELSDCILKISDEHNEYKWLEYKDAINYLKWDSNKTALWELNERIK